MFFKENLEILSSLGGKQPPGLKFIVRIMKFAPGKLVRDLCQPDAPIPDKWYYAMGQSLGTINKMLLVGAVDDILSMDFALNKE